MQSLSYKNLILIGSHLGLCGWMLYTAFMTSRLSEEALLLNYAFCAIGAFALFKVKPDSEQNV